MVAMIDEKWSVDHSEDRIYVSQWSSVRFITFHWRNAITSINNTSGQRLRWNDRLVDSRVLVYSTTHGDDFHSLYGLFIKHFMCMRACSRLWESDSYDDLKGRLFLTSGNSYPRTFLPQLNMCFPIINLCDCTL